MVALDYYSYSLIFLFIILIFKIENDLKYLLLLILITKIFFSFLLNYLDLFPSMTRDATTFESMAYIISLDGYPNSLSYFGQIAPSWAYSQVWGIIYSLTGRSELLMANINIIFSCITLIFIYKIIIQLYSDKRLALITTILCAFMPFNYFFSILTMRESLIYFIIIYFAWNIINYESGKKNILKTIILLINVYICLLISYYLHGPIYFCFVLTIIFFLFFTINRIISKNLIIYILSIMLIVFSVIFLFIIDISIPKFGNLSDIINPEKQKILIQNYLKTSKGNLSLSYFNYENLYIQILLIPIKFFYFLFNPFLNSGNFFVNFIYTLQNILMFILFVFLFLKVKFNSLFYLNNSFYIFILFILLAIIYSNSSLNLGTLHRHQTKVVYLFIIIFFPLVYNLYKDEYLTFGKR